MNNDRESVMMYLDELKKLWGRRYFEGFSGIRLVELLETLTAGSKIMYEKGVSNHHV